MLMPCSAIVTARDRRVRELFAVASFGGFQFHDENATKDAPPSTQALDQFLEANDILKYVWAIDLYDCRAFCSAFRDDFVVQYH